MGTGSTFDRFAYGRTSALGESDEDEWEPIALPRSSVPISDLHAGDLVVRRALGEGQLEFFHVLGQDVSPQSLYGGDGLVRGDTMVLRHRSRVTAMRDEQIEQTRVAPTFQVKLVDPQGITAQAQEAKYKWSGTRVQLELDGQGAKIAQQVSANGLFEIPSGTSTKATHSVAYRGGTYRSYVRWRAVTGGAPAAIAPGKPHTVEISSRLRLSLWAFTPPLTKETPGEIDNAQVQLLKDADVDDLSLVWTATWDTRRKPSDPPKPPIWDPHFVVRGSSDEKIRVTYLKNLIAALHPKVQVIAGYELVRATPGKQAPPKNDATMRDRVTDFAAWLLKATPDEIKKYAQSIREFFKSRGLDLDGVGYDFEFDQLRKAHRANLERLYVETSNAFADRNGLVSYANAPFKEDGVHSFGFMQSQPYAIAAQGRNLLARPMCFDAVKSTSVPDIEASIACALRAAAVKGGAGLHPSQVQFGIWADKVQGGADALCRRILRPNRIGLMVYNLPPKDPGASTMLRNCKTWNATLNPNEGPAGQEAQPLQVPRGTSGWPLPATT